MSKPFLIMTGIPRSGTTLTAALVDRLEDTLCLNEPPRYYPWVEGAEDKADFLRMFTADLQNMYKVLESGGKVSDRREKDGTMPENYFDENGQRRQFGFRSVGRPDRKRDLLLCVKHNEVFTAVLPELAEREDVQIIAIVRNPIPTMLSWQAREIPLKYGHLTVGYRFWPEAKAIEEAGGLIIDIQAKMFELYCARYWSMRDRITVIRYEDLMANPGVLEEATGRKIQGEVNIRSQNKKLSDRYGDARVSKMKELIQKHFSAVYNYYPSLDE